MARYEPVPLPSGAAATSRPDLAAGVTRWARSRPVRDLVAAFGGGFPDRLDTAGLLAWLDDFSADHWDFRRRHGAVERDEVAETGFPPDVVDLVRAAAGALGLVEPRPAPARRYDHLLVLGGLALSCLRRTAYAAQLIRTGAVEVGEVAALGSFRPLRPAETARLDSTADSTMDAGPELGYEVDAMDLGVRTAFGSAAPELRRRSPGAVDHHSWSVSVYRPPAGPVVRVLAAPSTEPASRRAHTSDTYHFWAGQVAPAAGDRVLVLTSQLYVPFQHCDAIRTLGLGYGCELATIGLDPAQSPQPAAAPRPNTDQYLQEIRSAVRSMRNLYHELD
ncbi:hypothetical protein [Plantactinospora sp. CA-290183]|uniref:hypothetical protein n=1 Tax=Plantactinospora sp. CA-290183 TaxID=3240006 RepID=UPI003D92A42A